MPKIGNTHDVIVGIDPGKSGAICFLHNGGNDIVIYPMPEDIFQINELLKTVQTRVVIEEIRSFGPGLGATAMFNFGHHCGLIEGIMIAYNISYVKVPPKTWQKTYGMQKRPKESKTQWKKRLAERAKELFPKIRNTLKTDWADAVLIAEHGRRLL